MHLLEVTFAGALTIRRGSRELGDGAFPGRQFRLVTAMIVLERADPLSVQTLADELWSDTLPAQWRVALRGLVSRTRRALADVGLPPEVIVGDAGVYRMDLGPVDVDLERGEDAADRATADLRAGDDRAARDHANEARAILSRPVLAGVDSDWLDGVRDRAARRHLDALVVLGTSRTRDGQYAQARSVLDVAIGAAPLREDAWRALMTCEFAAGNTAEALKAYESCRRNLAEELGVDPSEPTQALHTELLAAIPDPSPAPGRPRAPTERVGASRGEAVVTHDGPPYVGLRAFHRDDAARFFGRDAEVQELVTRLARHGIVAVVGPSGIGKSSLVRAGLLPALEMGAIADSDTWVPVVTTPGATPLKSLASELAATADGGDRGSMLDRLRDDPDGLHGIADEVLAGRPPTARLLVVLDQSEELFTLGGREEAELVVAQLIAASRRLDGRVAVVVALRADFYDAAAEVAAMADLLSRAQFVVPPLASEQVEQVVSGPATQAGGSLERGLLARIIADVTGQPGALPLLQHLLWELWQRRTDRVMTRGAYEDLGGVAGALANRAEAVYTELDVADRAGVRRLLLRGIQPGDDTPDTRRPFRASEWGAGGATAAEQVDTLVARLVDARLLIASSDASTGERTVELAHEALIDGWPRLRRWVDQARAWLLDHRRLTGAAADWARHDRHDDWLLAGLPLDEAHDLLLADGRGEVDLQLSPLERDLVEASLAVREHDLVEEERRRERERLLERRSILRLRGLVGLVVVVALVAAGMWWVARQDARTARAEGLVDRADEVVGDDAELAILLALEADRIGGAAVRNQVASALRVGIANQRAQALYDQAGEVVGLSSDGELVATARAEEGPSGWDVDVRNADTGSLLHTLAGHGGTGAAWSAGWSTDGSTVAVGARDGTVTLWSLEDERVEQRIQGPTGEIVTQVDLHPDGQLVAGVWHTGEDVGSVEVRAIDGSLVERFGDLGSDMPLDHPLRAAFSPDGDRLALAYPSQGLAMVVDTEDWTEEYRVAQFGLADVAWSPDGAWLAVAGNETLLADAESGEVVHELRGGGDRGGAVAWSGDSTRVAVAGDPARVWDVADIDGFGASDPVVLSGAGQGATMLAFGASRDVLREGSLGGVRTWNLADEARAEVAWLPGNAGQMGLDWSPDGTELATSTGEGELTVWDRRSWGPRLVVDAHQPGEPAPDFGFEVGRIVNLDWSPDGARIATAGFDDVAVWDAVTGSQDYRVDTGGHWSTVAWSPDSRHLAVDLDGPEILVVDRDGTVAARITDEADTSVEDLRFSPDGRHLATARTSPRGDVTAANEVRIWDWEAGAVAASLKTGPGNVHYDGSGARLLVAAQPAQLWDVGTVGAADAPVDRQADDVLVTFEGHEEWVQEAVLSPDEQHVATCSGDGTARLWDAETGEELERLVAQGLSGLCRLRFSPDGRLLAISDAGHGVRVLTLDHDELVTIATSRLVRDWDEEECQTYLDRDTCPPGPGD